MWKEAGMVQFKVLSRHMSGGTEENHENPQSEQQVSGPRFEPETLWIWSRSANHSTATFSLKGGYREV
jgi:hypothetical protein